jgi:hypothetical protein
MTVRRLTAADADNTTYRFTVRVQFADGIVGDLTTGYGVTWGPADNTYSDTDGDPGWLRIPAGVAAGTVVPITATWVNAAGTLNATANMVVAAPWAADPAMPKAVLVDGLPDTWAGTINPNLVPNVLFLGDGFSIDPDDQDVFEATTNKVVHDLKTDPLTRPYDRLAGSMNFWRVAVPSASRGISARCEVFTVTFGGMLQALPVPAAQAPPATGVWTIQHLIYASGLPLPTDVPPAGEDPAAASARSGALRARWASIARTSVVPAILSDFVVNQWALIGSRTFVDEIDAFPAMALGTPPAAMQDTDFPLLQLHPQRGGQAGLDAFYGALVADNNVAVTDPAGNLGALWAEDRASFRFDNRSLVVALAAYDGGRAQRTEHHIDISLKSENAWTPVVAVAGRNAVTIDQTIALSVDVEVDLWRVLAHELGHSFGLGDEYVELPGRFSADESTLDDWGNLTTETAVRSSAGQFGSALIKWNWRRARKAAVLSAPIVPPTGEDFDLKLGPGQAFQFAAQDKVRLRVRAPKKVLGRDPVECSTDLVAVSANAAGDVLTVHGSPNPVELVLLTEGSVVYVPVPMPDGSDGEARLVAPKVAKFIDDNNRPLTAWPCNPAAQLGVDQDGNLRGTLDQLPAFDLYPPLWSHRNDTSVVGLYEGGSKQGCGIYHPAGACMMRNDGQDDKQAPFCPVCRFLMVEFIDPAQHWWVDQEYDKIYPV